MAAVLASSLPCVAEGAPVPGGGAMPLVYEGPQLFDPSAPDGRMPYSPGVQNIQISRATRKPASFFHKSNGERKGFTYQHHIDIGCWKGRLYAVWDMSPIDEDALPSRLVYSTSVDGFNWSEPKDLFPPGEGWNIRFYFYHASNGRMLVFAAGPTDNPDWMKEKEKTTLLAREIGSDHRLGKVYTLVGRKEWHPPAFEESDDAGFIAACREARNHRPLLEQQDYGNFLGEERRIKWHDGRNWPEGEIGGTSSFWVWGKGLCFFHRKDGALVGLSKMGFATVSFDEGESWSLPLVPEGIVASSGKVWAQKTPDGRYSMIYPPQPKDRWPMVVTTSDDGVVFRDMRVVHGEVPPQRYAGKSKGMGPQYLRGVAEWAGDARTIDPGAIWTIYSVNKEDIWISRIPVPIERGAGEWVDDSFDDISPGPRVPGWNIYSPSWAPVRIAQEGGSANHYLELEDAEPVDYARAIRTFAPTQHVEASFAVSAAQTDRGRLEIELLGRNGTRPVRLVMGDRGRVQAGDGSKSTALGDYVVGKWQTFTIQAGNGRFTVLNEGRAVVRDVPFAEPSGDLYALSFRTGEFRGDVTPMATEDLPNVEHPVMSAVYRIDRVKVHPVPSK